MRKRIDENLRSRLAVFVKEYGRKAQRGVEPNDRRYDREIEKLVKKLAPEALSRLLNEEESSENGK